MTQLDAICCESAATLPELLDARIGQSPGEVAYSQYDKEAGAWRDYSWREVGEMVESWAGTLSACRLAPGERAAIWIANSVQWVCCNQALLRLSLVSVPLYFLDNPESIAYILRDSAAKILVVDRIEKWRALSSWRDGFPDLEFVLAVERFEISPDRKPKLLQLQDAKSERRAEKIDPQRLAMIVYTSSTTGNPKGVMLSHYALLGNARAVLQAVQAYPEDCFLSVLPLSHAFELTAGHLVPMLAGSRVAFCRSAQELGDDLLAIRPTVLIAVPRLFERACRKIVATAKWLAPLLRLCARLGWSRIEQGGLTPWTWVLQLMLDRSVGKAVRAGFGGRLRLAVSGGAPLDPGISHFLLGLGIPLIQGYGLTEAAPVVACNRIDDNLPESVGVLLSGVTAKLGPDAELLVKSPALMLGYWNRSDETRAAVDEAGWLHTGDLARIEGNRIYLQGRINEILVMSTGEKISAVDIETAIERDPLFEMALAVGAGKPFVAALIVINRKLWPDFALKAGVLPENPAALESRSVIDAALGRVSEALHGFPRFARVHAVCLSLEPWSLENGLLTSTMKKKRRRIELRYAPCIAAIYSGHEPPQMA